VFKNSSSEYIMAGDLLIQWGSLTCTYGTGLWARHEFWGQPVAVLGLSLWGGGSGGHGFWSGSIQSEQLHVSYYELYYASLWFWGL